MNKALVKNAADKDQVKSAENRIVNGKDLETRDTQDLMSYPHGRRYVWRLLEYCGVYKTSFTGNSTTFFNEGMRSVGLKILSDIMASCPDAFLTMTKENQEEGTR